LSSKCDVRIIPAAPQGVFLERKLRPDKNAIRYRARGDTKIEAIPLIPTPFYNATLQADTNFTHYLKLLHQSSKEVEGFADCCVLGQIWLRQRGLGGTISTGGFGQFEWAAMTALLLQGGGLEGQSILSSNYSSHQLFKAMVQYLANNNLVQKPVIFQAPGIFFPITDIPMFYDGPRGQNILFKMTAWSYALLFEEAKISLDMFNDPTFDQFEATFIQKNDHPLQKFDGYMQISSKLPTEERRIADHISPALSLSSKIYAVLKEGLTDRVKLIQIKVLEPAPWSLDGFTPVTSCELFIGVTFVPANIERVVDHGPAAEDKKAAIGFRNFWGEKAELRRFRDGSIRESCVWTNASNGSIFKDIVNYLIKRYFDTVVSGHANFFGGGFWSLLPDSSGAKQFHNLKESFDTFERDIRGVENIPLRLKQLLPTSSQLRHSSVQTPIFSPRQNLREPADIIIQFDGSGRWPDDIIAIQRTKIAFLLKIGNFLEASIKGLSTRLSLENIEQPLRNCAFLDVEYPSGAAFRVRIQCDREKILLDRLIKDDAVRAHSRDDIITARSLYTRMYDQLPLHSQSIAISCTRYPLLSPTIRLVKKWFMSHMLSSHIGEELIELIVARSFLQPYPWRAPSSLNAGFLRTLQFLSRWDWRTTPLVVDFSGTMAGKEAATIKNRLEAWRKIDPGMNRVVLIAASNHDMTGTAFTDGSPSKVVAARMTAVARSAWEEVRNQGHRLDPEDLFKPSISEYDFAIHISTTFATDQITKYETSAMQYKILGMQKGKYLSTIGYKSVQLFLNEIVTLYSPNVVFFHDPLKWSVITGLWSPQTAPRTFKVNTPHAIKPVEDGATGGATDGIEALVGIDKGAILLEIARLGGEMIARVDFHR
jgi:U3 small nucleolar RNA-associated protein 22